MRKKLLLLAALLSSLSAFGEDTTCYKKDWSAPSSIENVSLDGGVCNSTLSAKEMKDRGWFIKDIDLKPSQNGFSYTYVFTKLTQSSEPKKSIAFKEQKTEVFEVKDGMAKIDVPNLIVGQSGIVLHEYDTTNSTILSSAYVVESNEKYSILKLLKYDGLEQKALPTSKREVQDGDTFYLNYLYETSLIIAPNSEAFRATRDKFLDHNFLHSDIFASFLKYEEKPIPSKELIQKYAKSQNIGTIFFVIDRRVYIVDVTSFKIIASSMVNVEDSSSQLPFYTRVEEIEKGLFDFDIELDIDKILSRKEKTYTNHYETILGL